MPTVPVIELTHFCEAILQGAGVPRHKAQIAAACLISANLRGVDSHGIQLLPFYIDQLLAGEMDPRTDGRVISESGSCLHFDGQNGLGQWVAETCCAHAVRIARYIVAGDPGFSIARPQQSSKHPDQRGLAGAIGTEQPEDLAARHLKADVIDRGEIAEALGKAVNQDGGRSVAVVFHRVETRPPRSSRA